MTSTVFCARVPDGGWPREAEWLAGLPRWRRAEIAAIGSDAVRHGSLLAARLLMHGLHALGFGPAMLASWQRTRDGAAMLGAPLHCSFTHGGALVACALDDGGPIGVDVEPLAGVIASEFARYLDDDERRWAGESPERFLAAWTCKEAVAKAAAGRGLRDLPRVHVLPGARSAMLDGTLWQAEPLPLGPGHVGCLARRPGDAAAPRVVWLSQAELDRTPWHRA